MPKIKLTYCTNVHDLSTQSQWESALSFYGPAIREKLGWSQMPMGLWMQAPLAAAFAKDTSQVLRFLEKHRLTAFTCNAFPFGNFHAEVVKTAVYEPNWTTPERLRFTLDCAEVMAGIVSTQGTQTGSKAEIHASISTLPLGWRAGWTTAHSHAAAAHLIEWLRGAEALENRTGKRVVLALEAEPGCALERTPQVIAFWDQVLRPLAEISRTLPLLSRYLGVCYDTCHQAVQFENPILAIDALAAAEIPIHKVQLSSALEFLPDPEQKSAALRKLFAEPRFLHQTRIEGELDIDDLPMALGLVTPSAVTPSAVTPSANSSKPVSASDLSAQAMVPWQKPWRVHYHLPLQAESLVDSHSVSTTRGDMISALHHILKRDLCRHFEVETYTWSVLPESERPQGSEALANCLAKEIEFVLQLLPQDVEAKP